MKKIVATFFLTACTALAIYAQPGGGNPGFNPTPIDGGISLLIAAGAALGGKKAYDAYKKKGEEV